MRTEQWHLHPSGVRPVRVLVVDDQAVFRTGFSAMLAEDDDIDVIGEAGDGATAIRQAVALRPDVILMDVQMPRMDGIAATAVITEKLGCRVIILTTFDDDEYLFDGLAAGASGYLLKTVDADELTTAIRRVARGQGHLAGEVTRRVIDRVDSAPPKPQLDPRTEQLTPRELDVLTRVAHGLTNAEVAAELGVTIPTIKTHLSSCLAKLNMRDRVQLVIFAHKSGLLP